VLYYLKASVRYIIKKKHPLIKMCKEFSSGKK